MRIHFLLLALSATVLVGCWSGGQHTRTVGRVPDAIGAPHVSVVLRDPSQGLEDLQAALERSMVQRYRRSTGGSFGQIRFVIDSVQHDPVARKDLLLNGRLIVTTRLGTKTRTLQRQIHGGASSRPSQWSARLIPSLLNAIDFQLRLLRG